MFRTKFYLMAAILTILALVAGACLPAPTRTPTSTPSPTPAPAMGTLKVMVTDAPPRDTVTSIMVTASQLEIHKATPEQAEQQTEDDQTDEQQAQEEGDWITIDIPESARSFDLLKIKGVEELLAQSQIEAGKYTQVRLIIDKVEVALEGGDLKPATVPSGKLKFVHPFDVVGGQTTTILFDFDADKSVNVTGKGKIMVRPVVKLLVKKPGETGHGTGVRVVTKQESQDIAKDFVRNEATFVFDGMEDTLKLVETSNSQATHSWQFTFQFDSSHAGYGDRTGQVLAQVITPHEAVVTVVQGEVTKAIMDGKWDMLKQEEIAQ